MTTIDYIVSKELYNFEFWGGAKHTASHLDYCDFKILAEYFNEIFYNTTPTETQINDIFWFETDLIAEILGYDDWEDLLVKRI